MQVISSFNFGYLHLTLKGKVCLFANSNKVNYSRTSIMGDIIDNREGPDR